MEKVSIIVPMYNSEMTLERCLKSIQNQTYHNIEVLMMNDGSDDNTGSIAKKFCEADYRFKYYQHPNIGQGLSRNRGIYEATGEFISFVDSDDYIHPDMIHTLVKKIKESDSDVVCGEIVNIYPDGTEETLRSYKELENKIITKVENEFFYKNFFFTGIYSTNPVDKLYRSRILNENNIKFGDNNRINAEDRYFQLHLLLHIKKISFVNMPIYYYVQNSNSHSHKYRENLVRKELQMIHDYETLNQTKTSRKITSLLAFHSITREINNITNSNLKYKHFKRKMNEARKDKFFNKKLMDIHELKSYSLILDKPKRRYIQLVAFLEKYKLGSLSNLFIFTLYTIREILRGNKPSK